jgi:hypothetical protein
MNRSAVTVLLDGISLYGGIDRVGRKDITTININFPGGDCIDYGLVCEYHKEIAGNLRLYRWFTEKYEFHGNRLQERQRQKFLEEVPEHFMNVKYTVSSSIASQVMLLERPFHPVHFEYSQIGSSVILLGFTEEQDMDQLLDILGVHKRGIYESNQISDLFSEVGRALVLVSRCAETSDMDPEWQIFVRTPRETLIKRKRGQIYFGQKEKGD